MFPRQNHPRPKCPGRGASANGCCDVPDCTDLLRACWSPLMLLAVPGDGLRREGSGSGDAARGHRRKSPPPGCLRAANVSWRRRAIWPVSRPGWRGRSAWTRPGRQGRKGSHLHGVSSGGAAGTGRIWTLLRGRAWNPSCPRSVSWPRQDTGKNDRSDRERLPRIGPLSGGACDDQATCTVSGHDRGNAQRTGLRLKRSGRTRQGRASVMRRLSRGGPV